jgi:predicted exporter
VGRWGAVLVIAWCLLAAGVAGWRVAGGSAFDTDIQGLLPERGLDPVVRAALTEAGDAAARRIVVVVDAPTEEQSLAAAADLERTLADAGLFVADAEAGEELGRWLFANRNALLCAPDPARFDAEATVRRSLALLYSPVAPVSGELLARDPFLLTLQLAECLSPAASAGDAAIVSGRLTGSAYRFDVQDAVAAVEDAWRARWPDVSAARAGAVFNARDGAAQARREVSLFGALSAAGILGLLAFCLRRPSAVLGTLAVTVAGLIGSIGATLIAFPAIHILTFVFGSALIGVTSDYALHYLATGPQSGWTDPRARVREVLRPLLVCAASTSLGFASLALFGIGLFAQVAVFSIAGIATALAFTLTVLPLIDRRPQDADRLAAWWARLEAPLASLRWGRAPLVVAGGLVLAVAAIGAARFSVLDDVRAFQPRSTVLAAEEQQVRVATGFAATPSFLLSYGADPDEARRREEAALAAMPAEVLSDLIATSRFDPSDARREANAAALRAQLYGTHLAERAALLGGVDLDPFAVVEASSPSLIAPLSGRSGETAYLIAPLGAAAAASVLPPVEGSVVVDPAARYSETFAAYRGLAVWAVLAVFAVGGGLVLAVYRTPRALVILVGPALGAAMAVALPSAFGVPASFFTFAALFVVMGAGLDHAVFQFEAARRGGSRVELAVFLAAFTTVLSMGLLGLSGTYPVRSFGLAVAAGVTTAYVASYLAGAAAGRVKTERRS